ncbi:glucosaminidase domain-containing protein [Sulfurimonas microaerophilic]|uniref:glucosaminidase domain-containing protein n=1 Tax=Sulfurimonas microaerophilic TaxID=3058392 RepID=UPI0027148AF4|nr:glucosaminidase domain-containing protein [Sulfurimonas sp. hsl 1-7]
MRNIIFIVLFFTTHLLGNESLKKMSVKEKKKRFYSLVIPVVDKVYEQRYKLYEDVSQELNTTKDSTKIEELKQYYKVTTDQELLMSLKPQPKSMAIAQAAMESAWGTSRFFNMGNNLFGMWSISSKENRIAANVKRDNNTTVWVKKYDSLEESVRGYYITLSKGKQYKKLRELNYNSNDVYEVIQGLDRYSERKEAYVDEIGSIIRYNKLTKYDRK